MTPAALGRGFWSPGRRILCPDHKGELPETQDFPELARTCWWIVAKSVLRCHPSLSCAPGEAVGRGEDLWSSPMSYKGNYQHLKTWTWNLSLNKEDPASPIGWEADSEFCFRENKKAEEQSILCPETFNKQPGGGKEALTCRVWPSPWWRRSHSGHPWERGEAAQHHRHFYHTDTTPLHSLKGTGHRKM